MASEDRLLWQGLAWGFAGVPGRAPVPGLPTALLPAAARPNMRWRASAYREDRSGLEWRYPPAGICDYPRGIHPETLGASFWCGRNSYTHKKFPAALTRAVAAISQHQFLQLIPRL